jgi:hypothetical protein
MSYFRYVFFVCVVCVYVCFDELFLRLSVFFFFFFLSFLFLFFFFSFSSSNPENWEKINAKKKRAKYI